MRVIRKLYGALMNASSTNQAMKSAGYLYKSVATGVGEVSNPGVCDIYSVSGCISEDFLDYIPCMKHNGYWFFNSPDQMASLAAAVGISLAGMKLFFYRIYPYQWNEGSRAWENFSAMPGWLTDVQEPAVANSEGFDVVSYSGRTSPECSPLSCNDLAGQAVVNSHCLYQTLDEAKQALAAGVFQKGEPGPYRIIEVFSVTSA